MDQPSPTNGPDATKPATPVERTAWELVDHGRGQSAFDHRCEQAWAAVVAHMEIDRRYSIEIDEGLNIVFWVESTGYWHRMGATAVDPGFNNPPYVQVEFHLGNIDQVDLVAVARAGTPTNSISGVLVFEDSVRLFANRALATIDPDQFDQATTSINNQILSYCLANGGDPPPAGNWSFDPPSAGSPSAG